VIVDTPPIGNVIDSAIIAESCDGLVMVIEANAISYRFAQRVKEQLEKTSCPILGVILNKVDPTNQGYGKYGRYGKYGQYGRYGRYGKVVTETTEKTEE
jgi:Mrp family chromosome partitioning ATPase